MVSVSLRKRIVKDLWIDYRGLGIVFLELLWNKKIILIYPFSFY
jgi:hypothetical protein